MDKIEPKNENGIWVCPICGFKAMSKTVVKSHIERTHLQDIKKDTKGVKKKEKKAKKGKEKVKESEKKAQEPWRLGGIPVKKVRIYLRSGHSLIGEIVRITTYEIALKPNSHVSNNQIVVFKHAIDYLEVLE